MIPLNAQCLGRVVRDYLSYFQQDRTDDARGKDTPNGRPVEKQPCPMAKVTSSPRAGGLHHRYFWRAAAQAGQRAAPASKSLVRVRLWSGAKWGTLILTIGRLRKRGPRSSPRLSSHLASAIKRARAGCWTSFRSDAYRRAGGSGALAVYGLNIGYRQVAIEKGKLDSEDVE